MANRVFQADSGRFQGAILAPDRLTFLSVQGFAVLSLKLGYKAKKQIDPATLSAADMNETNAVLAAIDVNDDMQNVCAGLAG